MNRAEFLRRLEQALRGMPEDERRRAMEYYENYFDEAGPENEADVIRTLGAPEKVAADIRKGFADVSAPPAGGRTNGAKGKFRSLDSGQKLLLLVLACIAVVVIAPACVAVVGGLGGVLVALLCILASVFLLVPLLVLSAWSCAVVFLILALIDALSLQLTALLFVGIALICAAAGLLLWQLTVYLFRTTFPALLDGIAGLFRRVFHTR